MATTMHTGYTNNHIAMQWRTEYSDRSTRDRENHPPRLLFLDGHDSHVQVNLLEARWLEPLSALSFQHI